MSAARVARPLRTVALDEPGPASGVTAARVARILADERDVPGLCLLLDDDALAEWASLRGHDGPGTGYLRRYVRWKPGAGGTARLVPTDPRAPELFLAVWHHDAAAKLRKGVERAGGHVVAVDESLLALVATAPGDRDLPGLRSLAQLGPDRRPPVGREVRRALRHRTVLHPLAWKPQRRWVGRADATADTTSATGSGARRPVVVRAYRPGDLVRPLTAYRTVAGLGAGADGLRVPRPLAADTRRGLLVTEHLPGAPLDALLATGSGAERSAALLAAGEALARLHALPAAGPGAVGGGAADPVAVETAAVRAAGDLLARLRPDLPGRLRPELLVADVARALRTEAPGPLTLVHGDFSADQVLAGGAGAALLDLDEAGPGVAVADTADVLADWLRRDPGRALAHHEVLVAGYTAAGGGAPSPARLRPWVAARLLRRAVGPFRSCSPAWAEETADALADVRRVLDGGLWPT